MIKERSPARRRDGMGRRIGPLKAFDLFAGIGGFRTGTALALGNAVRFVGYCEIDSHAAITYRAMHDPVSEFYVPDITAITRLPSERSFCNLARRSARERMIRGSLPGFDLLLAGFPCQPHSLMGNRKGIKDERGSLFLDIAEVLRAMRPKRFVLENVRAIKSVNGGQFYAHVLDVLQNDLGYNVRSWELNAADYGITQVRRRLFLVGCDGPLPDVPPPPVPFSKRTYPSTWHLLERNVGDKYYLSTRLLRTILKHQHKGYNRKADINRLVARPLTRTMHKMHRASQDNYFSEDFIHGTYDEVLRIVHPARITNPRIRRITPREALRIQSFSEERIEHALATGVSDTQLYMQAGNAAPPLLVRAVVDHMFGGSS